MPPFLSTAKVVGSLLSCSKRIGDVVKGSKYGAQISKSNQIRWIGSVAGGETSLFRRLGPNQQDCKFLLSSLCDSNTIQKRWVFCRGGSEEGNVLAKVYEERLVLGYSPEQLYDVVATVDLYHGFVPWCQRSEIVKQHPDGSFDAELEIGFKFLVESYVSHVELNRPNSVKTTVSKSTLFDHLINTWEFSPGPMPGSCNVHFLVDFKFQSPLYRQVASVFFKEVISQLVGAFSQRCHSIYGPGVPILEKSHGQST